MKKKKIIGGNPIISILIITLIIIIISTVLSLLGIESQKTTIVNNELETSLITINNIFSLEGIKFILGNPITNFYIIEPLGFLIIALITVGFMDYSGMIKLIATPFKKIKPIILTFLVLTVSTLFSFLGDYSYLILMPLIALLYKELNKNPIIGIATVFLGLTLGYGLGFIFNYNDYLLGQLTEQTAKIEVDKNYNYHLFSNLYIMISSSILLNLILTYTIEKKIVPKFPKIKQQEAELINQEPNKKMAIIISGLVFIILIISFIYCLIPDLPYSGFLLNQETTSCLSSLFSNNEIIPYVLMIIIIITSYTYGKISKKMKTNEYFNLSILFNKIGYTLVLLFFLSQLISIIHWTNLGEVMATKLITFMAGLEFSGIPLIIILFIITILIGILIPSTITKWLLISPLIVPLFMKANITPDFTQFIYKVADGLGKVFNPIYVYFIIMVGFTQNHWENKKITIFGMYKLLLPTILMGAGLLLFIIISWFIIGVPLGPSIYATL